MYKLIILLAIIFILFACGNEKANQYYEQAVQLEDDDKYKEAIKLLDKAIAINPQFEQAYLDRAMDKAITNDHEGAIADLNVLIKMRPDGIEPYVWRAEYKRMLSRFEEALQDAEKAFKLKMPKSENGISPGIAQLNYDNPYIENTNYDIELEYILYERGASNFHLGNFEQALDDLEFCLQVGLIPEYTRYYRGVTLLSMGYLEEGCEDLKIAASLGNELAAEVVAEDCSEIN